MTAIATPDLSAEISNQGPTAEAILRWMAGYAPQPSSNDAPTQSISYVVLSFIEPVGDARITRSNKSEFVDVCVGALDGLAEEYAIADDRPLKNRAVACWLQDAPFEALRCSMLIGTRLSALVKTGRRFVFRIAIGSGELDAARALQEANYNEIVYSKHVFPDLKLHLAESVSDFGLVIPHDTDYAAISGQSDHRVACAPLELSIGSLAREAIGNAINAKDHSKIPLEHDELVSNKKPK